MKQKTLSKVFVWGFLILYILVALISFVHAISFFNIGNVAWMSVCLAAAFELGLALSLCSILLSEKNKKNALPWILMIVLTFVQIVGNVYATFSHITASGEDYYQNLAKPLLFFLEDVPEETVQVIISWIMGAILPVVALMMTDMIASNLKMQSDDVAEVPRMDSSVTIKPEIVKAPTKDDSSVKTERAVQPIQPVAEPKDKTPDTKGKSDVAAVASEAPEPKKFVSKLKGLWDAK